jgi:DNA-binding CsgD family transcriptional regulator
MDKYMRNDDVNEVYWIGGQETEETPLTIFKSKTPHQRIKDGISDSNDKECIKTIRKALSKLSVQELALWNRIKRGQSLYKAAKLMGISKDTAKSYWDRIKEKLQ